MTVEEIQQVLRIIGLERVRGVHPDAGMPDSIKTVASYGLRSAPGRTTLTFANFSYSEQEQIEGYAERLVEEAHALCMRLQKHCPKLREGDNGELWKLERVYKAQYHAMVRLRRRCDGGMWIKAHIRNARRWLKEAYVETVN